MASPEQWFKAVRSKNVQLVSDLLPTYARTQNKQGETALMMAAASNSLHLCRALAPHEHSMVNNRGYTALAIAAMRNHASVCLLLVKYEKAVPLHKDMTPLLLAIQSSSLDAVRVLTPYYPDTDASKMADMAVLGDDSDMVSLLMSSASVTQEDIQRSLSNSAMYTERVVKSSVEHNAPQGAQSLLLSTTFPGSYDTDSLAGTADLSNRPFSLSTKIGATVASTRVEQTTVPGMGGMLDSTIVHIGRSQSADPSMLKINNISRTVHTVSDRSAIDPISISQAMSPAKSQSASQSNNQSSVMGSHSARSTGVIPSRSRAATSQSNRREGPAVPNVSAMSVPGEEDLGPEVEAPGNESPQVRPTREIPSSASKKCKAALSTDKQPKTPKIDVHRLFPSPPRGHPGHSPSKSSSTCRSTSLSSAPLSSPTRISPSRSSPLRPIAKKAFIISSGRSNGTSPKASIQVRADSPIDIRTITVNNPFSTTNQKVSSTFYIAGAEEAPRSFSAVTGTPATRQNMEKYKNRYTALVDKYQKMRKQYDKLRHMDEKMSAKVIKNLNEVISTLQAENEEKTAHIERLQIENEELLWKLDEAEQTLQKTIESAGKSGATDLFGTDIVFPPNWEATAPQQVQQKEGGMVPRSLSAPRDHTDSKLERTSLTDIELDNIMRHLHTQSNLSRAAQIILTMKEKQHELESEISILKKKLEVAIDARDAEHNEGIILKQKLLVLEKDYLDAKASAGVTVQKDSDGNTRLIRAVAFKTCSDIKAIKHLIKEEAGAENNKGQTALMYAAALGMEDIGMLLIARESGHQDRFGCSALMIAVRQGLIGLSEALIHYEAGLRDNNGETALMILTKAGILESMYEAMAPQISEHAEHRFPSHLYMEHVNKLTGIIRALLDIEGGMQNNEGKTALILAAELGKNKILVELLAREAKLYDKQYRTALMIACDTNNLEAIHLLVPHEKCILRCPLSSKEQELGEGDFDVMVQSLRAEEQIKTDPMFGTTALMQMAYVGNYAIAQILMLQESGMIDQNGLAAIDHAVISGHFSIADMLKSVEGIVATTALDTVDPQKGHTASSDAASNNRTQLMQVVKQHRPGLTYCLLDQAGQQDKQGMTALMHAVLARNHSSVRLLVDREKGRRNSKGETALMLAILIEDKVSIEILAPHEQGIQDNDGTTALIICAYNNYKDLVHMFIEKEHGLVMIDGTSALMVAAEQGFAEVCAMLRPYELNITKEDGTTAYLLAKKKGHLQIAETLSPEVLVDAQGNTELMRQIIEIGVFEPQDLALSMDVFQKTVTRVLGPVSTHTLTNVERTNKSWMLKTLLYQGKRTNSNGKTALMLAVENRNAVAVMLLRKLEAKTTLGTFVCRTWKLTDATALIMAACYGYVEIVKLLAKYESRCVESSFYRTALMAAAYFNHRDCVEILLEHEAGMQRREGSTALMLAVTSGYFDIAALLVKKEANITTNSKSTYGEGTSALMMAAALNNYQMVELLAPYEASKFGRDAIYKTSDQRIAKIIQSHLPVAQDDVATGTKYKY